MPLCVPCPHCNARINVPDHLADKGIRCPHCNGTFSHRKSQTPARWFLARNKQQYGPYSMDQLREMAVSGHVVSNDMLLQEGAAKWVVAHSVDGLFQKPVSPRGQPPAALLVTIAPTAKSFTGPELIPPDRATSIVNRRFSSSPHFVALAVAMGFLLLLLVIWLIGIVAGGIVVPWVSFSAAMVILLLIVGCFISFTSAKARAIQQRWRDWRDVKIFFGLARLVLWEANEGLLLLKNKRVCDVIYGQSRGGGTAIIYPVLGEEVRVKIPLTFRPCEFSDFRVLSGDGIHLQIRLTFWWRILDERGLETFYLVVDREIHKATDTDAEQVLTPEAPRLDGLSQRVARHELGSEHHAAEIWIRKIVESCTRNLVSRTTANRALAQLTGTRPDSSCPLYPEAPDLLSADLHKMVQSEIERYGFYVDRVAIQDVQLPSDLQNEIHQLYQAKFIPARSQLEAEKRYNEIKRSLEASRDVIGVDATAIKEILESVRNNFLFGGLPPQLEALLAPFVRSLGTRLSQSPALPPPGQAAPPAQKS